MSNYANDVYVLGSGQGLYLSRSAPTTPPPSGAPSWLAAAPLNEWRTVPNSAGAGGSSVDAYSTFTLVGTDIWIAAQGGHTDSSDNRVVKFSLNSESPTWELKQAATTPNANQPYSQGVPSSRHGYYGTFYSSAINKVLLVGCNYVYVQAYQFPTTDGFTPNASTFAWDAPGTYAYGVPGYPAPVGGVYNNSSGGRYGVVMDNSGKIWDEFAQSYYNPSTNTWSINASNASAAANSPRYPWANNSSSNYLFGLAYGDGQGNQMDGVHCKKMVGNVQSDITFNASSALTQFITDQQQYAGMIFNPNNGKFLWYGGNIAGRMFEITVGSTTADIAAFAYGTSSGAVTPISTGAAGICGRFKYCPELNCAILIPRSSGSIYFMRLG